MRSPITALLVILLVTTSAAETLSDRYIAVADGDTITILTPAKRQVRMRLTCIDCPEKRQPFGKRAKQFTSSLVFGKRVRVEVVDRDRYGRAIGWVYDRDSDGSELCVNMDMELVRAGLAWVYGDTAKTLGCFRLKRTPEHWERVYGRKTDRYRLGNSGG